MEDLFSLISMTLSQENAEELHHRIENQLSHWLNPRKGIAVAYEFNAQYTEIKGMASRGALTQKPVFLILHEVASVLAEFIIETQERTRMERIIRKDFAYHDSQEIQKILQYCSQDLENSLDGTDAGTAISDHQSLQFQIAAEIEQHLLMEPHQLILEGWINFRLKALDQGLRETIEYAIEEFLMDQQYQEFITLLKYFVYTQKTKISAVHLMHKGGHEFILLDEQMKPMDVQQFESLTLDLVDREINFEDMMVSALIAVSPQYVHIHTREKEANIIKTIEQIFEGRSHVCEYCPVCQPFLGEVINPMHANP